MPILHPTLSHRPLRGQFRSSHFAIFTKEMQNRARKAEPRQKKFGFEPHRLSYSSDSSCLTLLLPCPQFRAAIPLTYQFHRLYHNMTPFDPIQDSVLHVSHKVP